MSGYILSAAAAEDLRTIYSDSWDGFGERQADIYYDDLLTCFSRLASFPALGRTLDPPHAGLRKLAHDSHLILYRQEDRHLLIVRILHQGMDLDRHV